MGLIKRKLIRNLPRFYTGSQPYYVNGIYNWKNYGGVRMYGDDSPLEFLHPQLNNKRNGSFYNNAFPKIDFGQQTNPTSPTNYTQVGPGIFDFSTGSRLSQPNINIDTDKVDVKPIGSLFQNGWSELVADTMLAPNYKEPYTLGGKDFGKEPKKDGPTANLYLLAGMTAVEIGSNIYNHINSAKSVDELNAEANRQQRFFNNVAYDQQNLNTGESYKNYKKQGMLGAASNTIKGAIAGAMVGGVPGLILGGAGAAMGSIFGIASGNKKYKDLLYKQRLSAFYGNQYNKSRAGTTGMMDDYYRNYGNTQDDILYV